MAKRKTKPADSGMEDADEGILAHFGLESPAGVAQKAEKVEKSTNAEHEALLARLADMEREQDQLRRTNLALLSTPPGAGSPQNGATKPQPVDITGLPDPLEDKAGYEKGLNERLQRAIDQSIAFSAQTQAANQTEANDRSRRIGNLWTTFSEQYGDYADQQDRVEFVATKVAERAQARGLDVERYMFTTSDLFFSDVVKEFEKTFGPLEAAETVEGEETPAPKGRKTQAAEVDEASDGRTAGIFGGQESGGAPSGKKQDKPTDMIEDLKELQRASGFY